MESFYAIETYENIYLYGRIFSSMGIVGCFLYMIIKKKYMGREEASLLGIVSTLIFLIPLIFIVPFHYEYRVLPNEQILDIQKRDSTTIVLYKSDGEFRYTKSKNELIFELGSKENIQIYRKLDLSITGNTSYASAPSIKLLTDK